MIILQKGYVCGEDGFFYSDEQFTEETIIRCLEQYFDGAKIEDEFGVWVATLQNGKTSRCLVHTNDIPIEICDNNRNVVGKYYMEIMF